MKHITIPCTRSRIQQHCMTRVEAAPGTDRRRAIVHEAAETPLSRSGDLRHRHHQRAPAMQGWSAMVCVAVATHCHADICGNRQWKTRSVGARPLTWFQQTADYTVSNVRLIVQAYLHYKRSFLNHLHDLTHIGMMGMKSALSADFALMQSFQNLPRTPLSFSPF